MYRENPIRLLISIEQDDPKAQGKLEQLSADCLALATAAIDPALKSQDIAVESGAAEFGNWGGQPDKAFLLEIPLNQDTLNKLLPLLKKPLSIPTVSDHGFSRKDSSISQKFADKKQGLKEWANDTFKDNCATLASFVEHDNIPKAEFNEKLRARFQMSGTANSQLADKPFPLVLIAQKFQLACDKLEFLVSSGMVSKSELEDKLNDRFGLGGVAKAK